MNNQIRARVDAFVDDLSSLIQEAALQAVQAALGGGGMRRAASPTSSAGAAPKNGRRKKAGRPGGGRSVDRAAVLEAIQAAGAPVRSATLAGVLGSSPPLLKPVLDELVASGQVKRAGMARGTTYEAGSGGGGSATPRKKKASKKAGRKKAGRRKTTTK